MKTCKHEQEGGQALRQLGRVVFCGKPAKHLIKCEQSPELNNKPVCGIHARFWKVRGFMTVPIIEVKP